MGEEQKFPPLLELPNGILIPTEELIIAIHDYIIERRKEFGKDDPKSIRDSGLIKHTCDMLADRLHKYKKDPLENVLYVATETFYYIACQHPFTEGNKSTAYVTALAVLYANFYNKNLFPISPHTKLKPFFEENIMSVPKEVGEITRLAEAGHEELELKRLIKDFLYKVSLSG